MPQFPHLKVKVFVNSLGPHGLSPARLLCPWDFPGNNTWMSPFPSPGDLPDPGIPPTSPAMAGGFFTTEPPHLKVGVSTVPFSWGFMKTGWVRERKLLGRRPAGSAHLLPANNSAGSVSVQLHTLCLSVCLSLHVCISCQPASALSCPSSPSPLRALRLSQPLTTCSSSTAFRSPLAGRGRPIALWLYHLFSISLSIQKHQQ